MNLARHAFVLVALWLCDTSNSAWSQELSETSSTAVPTSGNTVELQPTAKVDVQPIARDSEITSRLQSILVATEWFETPQVEVRDGVVFLAGNTSTELHKTWAGDLARRTQDVAAVVNKIQIQRSSLWDLEPAKLEIEALWRNFIVALPNVLLSLVVMAVAWSVGKQVTRISRAVTAKQLSAPLLREVLSRMFGVLVFLLGVYLVLRISGLTRLAVTVLGGTGLVGLVIGIAFRDITENFLASIFLSMQRPFQSGDLIEINGALGYVQRFNYSHNYLDDTGRQSCADTKFDSL